MSQDQSKLMISPLPSAASSIPSAHTFQVGGDEMKITNQHPAYASPQERTQRLADIKAICREKLSKLRKSTEQAS